MVPVQFNNDFQGEYKAERYCTEPFTMMPAANKEDRYQCCGSGSAFIWLSWIRIRIGIVDPDPGG
jgi:hypothetical protein